MLKALRAPSAGSRSDCDAARKVDVNHWPVAQSRSMVLQRKATKITSDTFRAARDGRGLGLQTVELPKNAPPGLKGRDFGRVHRTLDPGGTGLARSEAVKMMLRKLGMTVTSNGMRTDYACASTGSTARLARTHVIVRRVTCGAHHSAGPIVEFAFCTFCLPDSCRFDDLPQRRRR
eukprot:SAG11_NODE_737_length_7431_cov_7.438762_7_plen_176_part_00